MTDNGQQRTESEGRGMMNDKSQRSEVRKQKSGKKKEEIGIKSG